MNRLGLFVVLSLLGAAGGAALAAPARQEPGQAVLDAAFDPGRIFGGELETGGDDQLVLTAWASSRDDYAPAYSLAIAYRCAKGEKPGEWRCGFTARTLRTGKTDEDRTGRSLELAGKARAAASAEEMRGWLDKAALQWLEADVNACPNGIFAMDSVRIADWRPDIHFALQDAKDREIVMHPAAIRVRMSGAYATSTYQGWVLADGVPAAVRKLTETLEPCWKPATAPRPWKRR